MILIGFRKFYYYYGFKKINICIKCSKHKDHWLNMCNDALVPYRIDSNCSFLLIAYTYYRYVIIYIKTIKTRIVLMIIIHKVIYPPPHLIYIEITIHSLTEHLELENECCSLNQLCSLYYCTKLSKVKGCKF